MQVEKNNNTIQNAFSRLRDSKYFKCRQAMVNILKDAVEYALMSHDDRHQKHEETNDSYGWALWHNGQMIDIETKSGWEDDLKVETLLKNVIPRQTGFFGVVMAGMVLKYFNMDYENDILNLTTDMVRENFTKYFKTLK